MRAITKWAIFSTVFVAIATVKVKNDLDHWNGSITAYVASSLLIIPVIWYAGYYFREALQERHDGQY